jgi:hypothetical protein
MALSLDTNTYKKVMKDKFESKEIKCYDDFSLKTEGWSDLDKIESPLYHHI